MAEFRENPRHLFRKCFLKVPRFILEKVWEFFCAICPRCFGKCFQKSLGIFLESLQKGRRKDSRKGRKNLRKKFLRSKKIVIKI